MNHQADITLAWESTNAAGGALASALQALRTGEAVAVPDNLRGPSKPRTERDTMSEALALLDEAKSASQRAAGQAQLVIDDLAKKLRTRAE